MVRECCDDMVGVQVSVILYNYPCPRRPKKGGMQRNLYENLAAPSTCA